jgi:hypothetical protein
LNSKISLSRTQELFWKLISHPTGARDFIERANAKTRAEIELLFAETPEFSRIERLEVYADAYFYRLRDALFELFPITAWRLGEVGFHNLVTDYVLAHPSSNPDLGHLGDRLPKFLRTHVAGKHAPELPDVARIELALRRALDAPDGAPISPQQLGELHPNELLSARFRPTPHCALLRGRVNFDALSKAHKQGLKTADVEAPALDEATLVWRKGHQVYSRSLDDLEAGLLELTLEGATFEQACTVADKAGLTPQQLVTMMTWWASDGLLQLQ